MQLQFLTVFLCACVLGQSAAANAPDRSLRPVARPSLPSDIQLTSATSTGPVRPVFRPATNMGTSSKPTLAAGNLGFQRWIEGFRARAQIAGIQPAVFDRAFLDIQYNTGVIQKDRNQSEFTKTMWDYLDSAASDARINNGKAALQKHRKKLEDIERRFGVEKEVVVAVWGLESAYGTYRGTHL